MPSESNIKPRYFLLEEPLQSQHVGRFLGRLVAQKNNPIINYEPDPELDLNAIVPDLYPETTADFKDAQRIMNMGNSRWASIAIGKLLDVFAKSDSNTGKIIESPLFKRYSMERVPQKFEKLKKDVKYRDLMMKMLEEGGKPVAFVSGLLTCTDMDTKSFSSKGMAVGVSGGLPQEAVVAAGGPPGVELMGSLKSSNKHASKGSAKGVGEMIVAIAYHEVSLKKDKANFFGYSTHSEPVISEKTIKGQISGFFGPPDGSSENDIEQQMEEDLGFELCVANDEE